MCGYKKPGKPHRESRFRCVNCKGTNFTYQHRDNVPIRTVDYNKFQVDNKTGELMPYIQDIKGKMWLHICMKCRYAYDKGGVVVDGHFMKFIGKKEDFDAAVKRLEEEKKKIAESRATSTVSPTTT